MFAFHVNRLKACIFKVSQMSGFLVFPSSLPPWEKTQESLMQNASFAILETGHGNEELEQIDTCAQTHAKTKQIHAFTGAIRV